MDYRPLVSAAAPGYPALPPGVVHWGLPPGPAGLALVDLALDPAALSNTGAATMPDAPQDYRGTLQPLYGGDLFDRMHYSALTFALGNIVGDQSRSIVVWNAYYRAIVLEDLVLAEAEGITVQGLAPGAGHPPLAEVTYSLHISTDGPPTIDATLTWTYQGLAPVVAVITGSRVTAWSWLPDWSRSLVERLEWKTDVLARADGSEQRISVRHGARRGYEFTAAAEGPARQFLEAALWGWGSRVWALPLFHDTTYLAAALPPGSSTIVVPAAGRDFHDSGLAVLLGDSPRDYEVVEIADAGAAQVTLARPTVRDWPAGTRFIPARTARLAEQVKLQRFRGDANRPALLRFELLEPWDGVPATGPTYRGHLVLERAPNWARGLDLDLQRSLAQLDALTGPWATEDATGHPTPLQTHGWTLPDRAAIAEHRARLAALRGRQGALWVPTWAQDLTLAATVAEDAPALLVTWSGYTLFTAMDPNRRDLRIALRDGTVLYRRIDGATVQDEDTERLVLDAPLGVEVHPQDVEAISFMALCRQQADAAELAHWTADTAESSTTWQGFVHDV